MGGSCPSTFIRAHESMVWQLSECPGHTSPPVLAASLKAPSGRSASPSVESYLGRQIPYHMSYQGSSGNRGRVEGNQEVRGSWASQWAVQVPTRDSGCTPNLGLSDLAM